MFASENLCVKSEPLTVTEKEEEEITIEDIKVRQRYHYYINIYYNKNKLMTHQFCVNIYCFIQEGIQ